MSNYYAINEIVTYRQLILYRYTFLLEVTVVLATFAYPNHIVIYATGDEFTGRLAVTASCLGKMNF
ncbi:hypothetical protein VAEKB19_5340013 [Vibrio aestuarianus]|nr:hypothetical protein VAEKB19_5340013 [Vibrio aestuarianus]